MVHNAFDERCIVKNCPAKIESAIYDSSGLYVGCIDGSLRIYTQEESHESLKRDSPEVYGIHRTIVGFAKKSVSQMDLVKSHGMLISLAETVGVYSLPGFEPVAYLPKTKGANLFCWDEVRGLLCVAKQKRLLTYRHNGGREFVEVKELSIPDVVKSMVWCGDCVCIGVKREYIFVNVISGASTDIFPCGRTAPPLVVSLPRGELLLGKDNIGVFINEFGKVTQQGALSWSESPTAVMAHPPYVLGRLSRFIEVRSLREPYGLVQMIPHKDMQLLQSDGFGVLAVSDTSVYKLVPVEIGVQVVQLAASGNFEEALALCKLMPPEDAAVRSSKEDSIHIRYGRYLYSHGQYAEALQQFAMSSLSLPSIIYLFPSIKLPKFCTENEFKDFEILGDVDTDGNEGDKSVSNTIALSVLATFLMNKRGEILDKAQAEDANETIAALVQPSSTRRTLKKDAHGEDKADDLRKVACVLDTALVQALLLTNQPAMAMQLLKGSNYCDVEACQEMMISGGFFKELIQLYNYNKMHQEALQLLERSVEKPESLPVPPQDKFGPETIVEYLQPLGGDDPHIILEYSGLLLKYGPEQAMKLFTSTNPPLPANIVLSKLKKHAPELQVVYLEEMIRHNPDSLPPDFQNELVVLYLSHALEEHAKGKGEDTEYSEAEKKLLKAVNTFTSYNPQDVLKRLPRDGLYEVRAILYGKLRQHQLALSIYVHKLHDQRKALEYCDRVYEELTVGVKNLLTGQKGANVYSMLLEIYLKPKSSLRELRLIFSGKSKPRVERGGYKTRVKKITQIEEAEYMTGNESTAESSKSDTEETGQTKVEDVMLGEAINLLSCRWDCFDAAQVLRLLPNDAKLKDLLPFLEPLLRRSTERSRNAAVIRRVQYSDNIEVRYELMQCRKRRNRQTADTRCAICKRTIGPSTLLVYPKGTLAHFVCSEQHERKALGP